MPDRIMMKGNVALAEGSICAGCRFYFGYPITPQNDIPEYLSRELPKIGGTFIQAESEIASINMMLGASAAGARVMTSSSGPGISLMQEGISYMAGSELPAVVVNIMRSGPGLGGIAPTQGDYKQAVYGGGHGDYRTIVLAPYSPQEMFDLAIKSFELADKYRNPAVILADAILGLMKEPVKTLSRECSKLSEKPWALTGAKGRAPQLIKSLYLKDGEMEKHNWKLYEKYKQLKQEDTMFDTYKIEDADFAVVAFGSAARVVVSAIEMAREKGLNVGLIRPITLFPFPDKIINDVSSNIKKFLTVEFNTGQMVNDVRLAVKNGTEVFLYPRPGGSIPAPEEVLEQIEKYYG